MVIHEYQPGKWAAIDLNKAPLNPAFWEALVNKSEKQREFAVGFGNSTKEAEENMVKDRLRRQREGH